MLIPFWVKIFKNVKNITNFFKKIINIYPEESDIPRLSSGTYILAM